MYLGGALESQKMQCQEKDSGTGDYSKSLKSLKAEKIKVRLFLDLRGHAQVNPCIYMEAECIPQLPSPPIRVKI